MKHTKEPWSWRPHEDTGRPLIVNSDEYAIALVEGDDFLPINPAEEQANARRIIECVNACAGLNPETIKDLVKAAEVIVNLIINDESRCEAWSGEVDALDDALQRI